VSVAWSGGFGPGSSPAQDHEPPGPSAGRSIRPAPGRHHSEDACKNGGAPETCQIATGKEISMQFMLLIYEDDAERVEKMDERMPICAAYAEAMKKAGIYVTGNRLRGVGTATSVRVSDGKTRVVDGPYAEAKEQLGGFHVIDVPDLDTALAWAARCPSASRRVVEVRPIWPR